MSRAVEKPHGLVISSGNYFYCSDPDGTTFGYDETRDGYNALVSFHGYTVDEPTTAHAGLATPAQQIVWETNKEVRYTEFEGKQYPSERTYYTLRPMITHWLKETVGARFTDWDVRTKADNRRDSIFFRRRKDALAFCNMIADTLSGLRFSDW